jgi:hypothetical protein
VNIILHHEVLLQEYHLTKFLVKKGKDILTMLKKEILVEERRKLQGIINNLVLLLKEDTKEEKELKMFEDMMIKTLEPMKVVAIIEAEILEKHRDLQEESSFLLLMVMLVLKDQGNV